MRILITSDLHGLPSAYHRFAYALQDYDLGVLAGDNLDEYIPEDTLIEMLDLDPDEFLDELPGADDTAEDSIRRWQESRQATYLRQGLLMKEKALKDILCAAGRPVLVVPGNHEATPWEQEGNVTNIHLKRIEIEGIPFVGYGALDGGLDADRQMRLLQHVENLIDEKTFLITHFPPYLVFDHDDEGTPGFGSRILAEMVERRKPLYHIFGHTHSAFGVKGNSINASFPLLNLFYALDTHNGTIVPTEGRGRILQALDDLARSELGRWLDGKRQHIEIRDWIIQNAKTIDADPQRTYRATIVLLRWIYRQIVHGHFNTINMFGEGSMINRILGGGITDINGYAKIERRFDWQRASAEYFANWIMFGEGV